MFLSRFNNFISYKIIKINQTFYWFCSCFFIFFVFIFSSFSFYFLIYWKFCWLFSSFFWFFNSFINIGFIFSFSSSFSFFFFFWWFSFCFNFSLYLFLFSFFLLSLSIFLSIKKIFDGFFRFFWTWFFSSIFSFSHPSLFIFLEATVYDNNFFLIFLSNVVCIRISIVFNIIFIIIWWYLVNNFLYNCLSSFYFICFVYLYFSIKIWKFFQKIFIANYVYWLIFNSSSQSISWMLRYCFCILYFRFLLYFFLML